ncbi:TetR family transcriptional regulator, partial [Streptomyces sp. NPDC096080]|uniref:TetR family transcriptional regulator n=1 Tax=Streptomyces sp. NPDC096080 TaxID=3156693 RepID=UPI00332A0D67
MQYVQGMPQPARSPRTAATPDVPESAAGTRAAAQRLKMRRELAAAAMELFSTKGYEATTVDEIAAGGGGGPPPPQTQQPPQQNTQKHKNTNT